MRKWALLGDGLYAGKFSKICTIFEQYKIEPTILTSHEKLNDQFELAISFGYRKLIPAEYLSITQKGVFVFHSSNLPEGRGWAPLFYTIYLQLPCLSLSLIKADKGVDNGEILLKVHYPLDSSIQHEELRIIDDQLVLSALPLFIEKIMSSKELHGQPQKEELATYYPKRTPSQSQISPQANIDDLYLFIKALPPEQPAFFYDKNGNKVKLKITIEKNFVFNSKLIRTEFFWD